MTFRVLVVDDDPLDREIAVAALRGLTVPAGPADVTCVGDCAAARARLGDEHDLVLLDVDLPDGRGLDLLRELSGGEHAPVIMLTAQRDVRTAIETLRAGAYDYVAKIGAWGTALAMTVERVVERVGVERELAASRRQLARYATEVEHEVASRTTLVRAQAAKIEELCLELEQSARRKSELIASVSKGLRTPLDGILGYAELLEQRIPAHDLGEAHRMLAGVRGQADQLRQLVDSLLAPGGMNGGAETVMPCRFAVASVLDELRAEADVLAGDGAVRFEWRAQPPDAEVETDREKLGAIAYHLLSNAIELTPGGRIVVTMERGDDGRLILAVSDTGIGLAPEIRALVCDDVRRPDGSSSGHESIGLGLGLGIVKRYTALLRGSLRVESASGNGTTITVELPPFGLVDVDAASTRVALRHPPH